MSIDRSLITLGLEIGLALAVVGALVEFWLFRRRAATSRSRQLPGCLLYMGGLLALAGILAILGSPLVKGSIGPALSLGAGVLGGFYLGFAVLFLGYLFFNHFWPDA